MRLLHSSQIYLSVYVQAMQERYRSEEKLDERYIEAMEKLHNQYPTDSDVAVLLAEALLMPISWDYYTSEGSPRVSVLAPNPEVLYQLTDCSVTVQLSPRR
jgi:hypothetical protein